MIALRKGLLEDKVSRIFKNIEKKYHRDRKYETERKHRRSEFHKDRNAGQEIKTKIKNFRDEKYMNVQTEKTYQILNSLNA